MEIWVKNAVNCTPKVGGQLIKAQCKIIRFFAVLPQFKLHLIGPSFPTFHVPKYGSGTYAALYGVEPF